MYMTEKTNSYDHLKNITTQLSKQVTWNEYINISKNINLKLWPRADVTLVLEIK